MGKIFIANELRTDQETGNGNRRSPSGMTNKKVKSQNKKGQSKTRRVRANKKGKSKQEG